MEFFGGEVDFNDCDNVDCDVKVRVRDSVWGHKFAAEDGEEWEEMQTKILDAQPLTKRDISRYNEYAADK